MVDVYLKFAKKYRKLILLFSVFFILLGLSFGTYAIAQDVLKSDNWQLEPGKIILGEKPSTPKGESIINRTGKDILERRDMFSRTFRNSNGTLSQEVFLSPIHYLNNNGEWQPIDTTIVRSTDKDYEYMNTTNLFETYFNTDPFGSKRNVKYKVGDAWMEFRSLSSLDSIFYAELKNKFKEQRINSFLGIFNYYRPSKDEKTTILKNRDNTLRYPKVLTEGTQEIYIDYSISELKLLEEIILTEKQEFSSFSQNVVLHNVYIKEEGDTIVFYNKKTDKPLWRLSKPVMYEYFERWDESQHNPSRFENYGLKYKTRCLNKSCSNLIISKVLTEEGVMWLNDENRQYPVIIDLTADYDFTDVADNWAYEKGGDLPTNQLNYDLTATTSDYTAISLSNDSRWSSSLSTTTGQYDSQIFRFTIDEAISEIASINVQWEGYGSTPGSTTTDLKVWNNASSTWELLDAIDFASSADLVASGTISSNISSYIDGSTTLSVLAYSEKSTYDDGESCTIDGECTSGNCADGYCCDTACDSGCVACDLSGTEGTCTTTPDTNWGAGLYGCTASDARCVSGVCKDCSDTGGYFYSDGCSGCAGQGSSVCWRLGSAGGSCTSACSSYGGCDTASWNDNASCTVLKAFGTCNACNASSGTYVPYRYYSSQARAYYCYYQSGSQSCSASLSARYRICVCQY
jgi:hypothetical protein